MFENLSERLERSFKILKGEGKITEINVAETLKDVRKALLEADVNYKVAKNFTDTVKQKALGQNVLTAVKPSQLMVKIVHDELTELMGGKATELNLTNRPAVILMAGLNGAGKTTMSGKLALLLKNQQHRKPLLAACDTFRPAAMEQLRVLADQVGVPIFMELGANDPVEVAQKAIAEARAKGYDTVIVDTAGRQSIDEELMLQIQQIKSACNPDETLLVVDAMTGQDAVNVAQAFNEDLGIDGIVLTKLDGDTRGGAALSVKKITNRPIKFIANGEKLSDIEEFHPDRMAQRILGMGDVLSLIEKAEETFDLEESQKLQKKLRKQKFDLNDYLAQLKQIKKMGSISSLLKMIPGLNKLKDVEVDEKEFVRIEAMINSMTEEERTNPKILNGSRRLRIANGSGTTVQQLNKFMNSFEMTQKMMKQMTSNKGAMRKMMKNMNLDDLNTGDIDLEKMDLKDMGIDFNKFKK